MSLSNLVVTKQIEPVMHTNYRTEFVIPSELMLSNPRLLDVGVFMSAGTSVGTKYPLNSGGACVIRNISLLSDNQLLCECKNVYQYLSFDSLRSDNGYNYSVESLAKYNSLGFYFDPAADKINSKWGDPGNPNVITSSELTTPKARVLLSSVLPIFNAKIYSDKKLYPMKYFQADKMKNLRLVIEYQQTAPANMLRVVDTFTSYGVCRPTLVIDQVVGKVELPKDPILLYVNPDMERISISATAGAGQAQSVSKNIQSVQGKKLHSFIFQNVPSDVSQNNQYLKQGTSIAQLNEVFQFTINGQKYLPFGQLDSYAKKAYYCSRSIGDLNVPSMGYAPRMPSSGNAFTGGVGGGLVSNFSWGGLSVDKQVDKMQFDFSRTGLGDVGQNAALDLYFYLYTERVLRIKDGALSVSY